MHAEPGCASSSIVFASWFPQGLLEVRKLAADAIQGTLLVWQEAPRKCGAVSPPYHPYQPAALLEQMEGGDIHLQQSLTAAPPCCAICDVGEPASTPHIWWFSAGEPMPAAKPLAMRVGAVTAYIMCLHFIASHGRQRFWREFDRAFIRQVPDHNVSQSYARKFALKWYTQFEKEGHVFEKVRRRPSMPANEVRMLGDLLMQGYKVVITVKTPVGRGANKTLEDVRISRQRYYKSIAEFIKRNPVVQEKMDKYKIKSPKTLLRLLHKYCPRLRRRVVRPRAPLNPEQVLSRKKCVFSLLPRVGMYVMPGLDLLLHYLYRSCWVDSKKYYIFPRDMVVWAPADVDMTDPDPRLQQGTKMLDLCVNYYVVVNALLGCVYFEYVHGTTDHEGDPNFETFNVSAPNPPPPPPTAHKNLYELPHPA